MVRWIVLAWAGAGCAGSDAPVADGAALDGAADEQPPAEGGAMDLPLDETPTPMGGASQALGLIADAYGVGRVRCPIGGVGTSMRQWGTHRDQVDSLGASLRLHQDPYAEAPWSPLFDKAYIEKGWVTLLAAPGSTSGHVRSVKKTIHITWPEAMAGEVVVCTEARVVPPRPVSGAFEFKGTERAFLFGCGVDRKLMEDGEWAGDATVPCTLWAWGTDGTGTAPQRIEPGAEPIRVDLKLELEPMRGPDGKFTEAGLDKLMVVAKAEVADLETTLAMLDEILADPDITPGVAPHRSNAPRSAGAPGRDSGDHRAPQRPLGARQGGHQDCRTRARTARR